MEETQVGTKGSPRPTRWPWIYAFEPTVFWGIVALLWGAGTLACCIVTAVAAVKAAHYLEQIQILLGK